MSQSEENEGYIKGSLLFNKSSNYFFLCYVNATIGNQMPHHLKCPFKKCTFCFVFSNIFWKVNAQYVPQAGSAVITLHDVNLSMFWGGPLTTLWLWGPVELGTGQCLRRITSMPSWLKHHLMLVMSLVFRFSFCAIPSTFSLTRW